MDEEKYYLFRIVYEPSSRPLYLYEVNISEKRAIECAVNIVNRKNVAEMHFDDRIIYPKRVGPHRIFLKETPFRRDSHYLHKNYPEGYNDKLGGKDVTDEIFSIAEKYVKEPLTVTKEGVFFSGQQYDAFKLIKRIFNDAEISVIIIDCYVDERVLNMLESKKDGVEVKILTLDSSAQDIRANALSFNRQHGNLEIRSSRSFHDRFVIIDDEDFYHFGHSLKDLGDRGCMFSRIEEAIVIDALRKEWKRVWESARR